MTQQKMRLTGTAHSMSSTNLQGWVRVCGLGEEASACGGEARKVRTVVQRLQRAQPLRCKLLGADNSALCSAKMPATATVHSERLTRPRGPNPQMCRPSHLLGSRLERGLHKQHMNVLLTGL